MASRKRRCPTRFEEGRRSSYHDDDTPKDAARREYFFIMDATISTITERFSQTATNTYHASSRLVKSAIDGNECAIPETIAKLYSNDFNFGDLEAQLGLVHSLLAGTSVSTMKEFATWLVATPS